MALKKLNFEVEASGNAAANAEIGASRWTSMKLIAEGVFRIPSTYLEEAEKWSLYFVIILLYIRFLNS